MLDGWSHACEVGEFQEVHKYVLSSLVLRSKITQHRVLSAMLGVKK